MTTSSFNDLPWHDAVVLELRIDRRRAGHADEVVLAVMWPDERRSRLRFEDCYGFEAQMNFGVVAAETVRSAVERGDSAELEAIRAKWKPLRVDLSGLKSFTIETNSTASKVVIYAQGWVEELEN